MMTINISNRILLRNASTIRRIVCEHYKIPIEILLKPGRANQHVSRAKQVICYLLFRVLGVTQRYAAEIVAAKTHGSASEGAKVATDQMSVYPQFKAEVEMLEAKCWEAIK